MEISWLAPLLSNWVGWDLMVGLDSSYVWWFKFEKGDQSGRVCRICEDDAGVRDIWVLMDEEEGGGSVVHVRSQLETRLKDIGLATELASGFPFLSIAKTAIKGFDAKAGELSQYYPEDRLRNRAHRGLEWTTELDIEDVDKELVGFLSSRMNDRKIPQAIRHKLQPFLTQWEDSNGFCFLREPNRRK